LLPTIFSVTRPSSTAVTSPLNVTVSLSSLARLTPASIRQALAPLPNFSDQYPVLGSWLVDHEPCGLSIREDENPITGNTSRFVPHAIL